ncbi:MAG: hypothetical protein RI883_1391 [Bacteroidota bacterium]|jgi:hypothetical protein
MKSFYSIIVLSFILASCSTSNTVTSNHFFQKRKYTSGWNLNHSTKIVSSNEESINETPNPESSISSKIKTAEPLNLENTNPIEQSECDTIILNNGQIVRVNIINTTATLVRYTKCDSEDQTELILAKEEVKALQYANGDFEFIKHSTNQNSDNEINNQQNTTKNETNDDLKKVGIAAGVMVLIILIVAGVAIFGIYFLIAAIFGIF